jgi:hypothetical protein
MLKLQQSEVHSSGGKVRGDAPVTSSCSGHKQKPEDVPELVLTTEDADPITHISIQRLEDGQSFFDTCQRRAMNSDGFYSLKDAWRKFKLEYGKKLNLDEAMQNNPLPDTFIVEVSVPENIVRVTYIEATFPQCESRRVEGTLPSSCSRLALPCS